MSLRRTHKRVFALAAALVWAVASVGAAVHAESHGHRFCEEHGTFEDVVVDGSGGLAPSSVRDGVQRGWMVEEGADHVECAVAHFGSRDALIAEERSPVAIAALWDEDACGERAQSYAPIDRLALAPKLSPPDRS